LGSALDRIKTALSLEQPRESKFMHLG
jgi:hypothetical protein